MASPQAPKQLRVAIVHDWLYGGGAEWVVAALHKLYPDAPIYTSYCSDEWRKRLDNKVVTGYLQRWPFNKLRKFLPVLRMRWFSRLDFSGYDLVISSSGNGEAMGIRVPEGTVHVSYCHTPTHYYWRHYNAYMRRPGFGIFNPLARLGLRLLVAPLRRWDYRAAQGPDYLIANSSHIQRDIQTYYNRESVVVHPPIDTARFSVPEPASRRGFVTASRLAPMKRIDLIVEACTKLGLPLKVMGRGPDMARLQHLAGPTVQLLGYVPDEEMPALFAGAEAFLFASFDDFGIVPVEAMAAGTPVIAYKAGGALDYVCEGQTGAFFAEQTVASLCQALEAFEPQAYDHDAIRRHANQFSEAAFLTNMRQHIAKALQQHAQ